MAPIATRALLIANPGSRGGARLAEPAREAFRRAGVDVEVLITEAAGHGGSVARERAKEFELIFSLGGDGTAMEVVQALMGMDRAVGILPGGTGNLLARALRVPLDIRAAVPALLNGTRKYIDLGRLADGRRFAIAAGMGVDADMVAAAPLALRQRFGVAAYFATATQSYFRLQPFSIRATVDGQTFEREHCVAAMIVNMGSVLDGMFRLGPGISYDDGGLDLCVYSARGFTDAAIVAGRLLTKRFTRDRRVLFARGARVTLEATPPRMAQADGELLGAISLSATVEPGIAPLLVPRR